MMEKLGAPQTHLDLKAMIKEVDEDGDNKISFREVSKKRKISFIFADVRRLSQILFYLAFAKLFANG